MAQQKYSNIKFYISTFRHVQMNNMWQLATISSKSLKKKKIRMRIACGNYVRTNGKNIPHKYTKSNNSKQNANKQKFIKYFILFCKEDEK